MSSEIRNITSFSHAVSVHSFCFQHFLFNSNIEQNCFHCYKMKKNAPYTHPHTVLNAHPTLSFHIYITVLYTSHINKKIIKSINGRIQVDIKIDGDVTIFLAQNKPHLMYGIGCSIFRLSVKANNSSF